MNFSNSSLINGVQRGDMRAVARLITLIENDTPRVREVQAALFKNSGRAHVIGVTGAPGAGKSTLVDQLALQWKAKGKKVAVLAVDPSSPFSGGAILGDRIRMQRAGEDADIYIRSMATRGYLGGVSRATLDAVQVLDTAGFDIVFVETVGVGQGEVDIVRTADTCIVVLVPGMGDGVQAIKAGILEIADIFAINKCDRDGADLLQKDLRMLISLAEYSEGVWKPPITRTVATEGAGVPELIKDAEDHIAWLKSSGEGRKRKLMIIKDSIVKLAGARAVEKILTKKTSELEALVLECAERRVDPHTVVERLLSE